MSSVMAAMERSTTYPFAWARVYRSFIAGLALVLAATYLLELSRATAGMVSMHQLMNALMGCFLVVFAVPKLFNLTGFIETFQQYDVISQKFPVYARVFPYVELTLGFTLLSNVSETSMSIGLVLNATIAIVTGMTLIGVMRSLRQKKQLRCACLGAKFAFPLSKIAVIENSAMLLMALSMLCTLHSSHMLLVSLTHFRMMNA